MLYNTNAKKEFLNVTKGFEVISAIITFGDDYLVGESFKLKPLYNRDEWKEFMKFLNRDYDSGFGSQNLFGVIFCENGVWMTRKEYDGAESWRTHKYPDLRDYFEEKDILKYERRLKIKNIEQQDPQD